MDKGDAEQRGVQLQTVTKNKQTKYEFLHVLQPILSSDKTPAPQVERTADGLKIVWANGDEDLINLLRGERGVERRRSGKQMPKPVLQDRK